MTPDEIKMRKMMELIDERNQIKSIIKEGSHHDNATAVDLYTKNQTEFDRLQDNARNVNSAAEQRAARSSQLESGAWKPKDVMNSARSYDNQQSSLESKRPLSTNYIDTMQDKLIYKKGSPGLESSIEEASMRKWADIGALKDAGYDKMVDKRNYKSLMEQGKTGFDLKTMKGAKGTAGYAVPSALAEMALLIGAEKALSIPSAGEGSDIIPAEDMAKRKAMLESIKRGPSSETSDQKLIRSLKNDIDAGKIARAEYGKATGIKERDLIASDLLNAQRGVPARDPYIQNTDDDPNMNIAKSGSPSLAAKPVYEELLKELRMQQLLKKK